MNKYQFPILNNYKILYKGRRYLVFEVSQSSPFESMEDVADFVVWDGDCNVAVSYGTITSDGGFEGFLAFSHVEIEVESADNIRDFLKNYKKSDLQYFKACY